VGEFADVVAGGHAAARNATSLPAGIVTFVFTDIEGSTRLFRRLGDRYAELLDRHHEVLRDVWSRFRGREVKTEGDAFFVAFGDAAAAIDACVEAQRCLSAEPWPVGDEPRVRMGVHSGLAYPRGDDYVAYAVHQAARVVATGHGGQVVVSAEARVAADGRCQSALQSLGRFRVRDFDEPVELFQAWDARIESEFGPLRAVPADGHNLVRPRSSFVGRDTDLADLYEVVQPGGLVTVVGPGGVGKTRLVTEWGLAAASRWPDGVWLVELGPLSDGLGLAPAVANAIGARPSIGEAPSDAIASHVAHGQTVLVLDNCEHLVTDVAIFVDVLLARCPGLSIVATSREPLRVEGEVAFRLAPLDTDSVAVALFVERSRAAARHFELDADGEQVVRELCRRLDGLPLAIELAAARISMLSPKQILKGLDDARSRLQARGRDVPDRQRTMEATLTWSWELLDVRERTALARLALFVDGFDHAAAEAATAWGVLETEDVTELLLSLIDKSLIIVDSVNSHRSRLLETVRAYAAARLGETDGATAVALRVCDNYLDRFGPQRHDRDVSESLQERENFAALVDILSAIDVERAQTLAYTLTDALRFVDAKRARAEAVAALGQLTTETPTRVALLGIAATLATDTKDLALAHEQLDQADALRRVVGQPPEWAENLIGQQRAVLAVIEGQPIDAVEIADQMVAQATTTRGRLRALNAKLLGEVELGQLDAASQTSEQCVALSRDSGNQQALVVELGNAAEIAFRVGDRHAAAEWQRSSLELALELGDLRDAANAAVLAARLAAAAKNWDAAARLQCGADELLERTGSQLYPTDRAMCDELLREAAARLGPHEYALRAQDAANFDVVQLADAAHAIFDSTR
jgi:predicted ATPase/class 3 adenylate cyclase